MKTTNKILLFLLAFMASSSFAITDFSCMSDCEAKGYIYNVCEKQCSTDNSNNNIKSYDYNCINDCTDKGYMYSVSARINAHTKYIKLNRR